MTPKKTPEKQNEDDEYAGSTDVDEPGLHQTTLIESPTVSMCVTELYLTFRLRFSQHQHCQFSDCKLLFHSLCTTETVVGIKEKHIIVARR